ncbi:Glucose oxidase 1 [Colletotrichum sp. SAR11_240]|nr:Glucose oxidase 1 [Colletotrichum sp. SAR11_240]
MIQSPLLRAWPRMLQELGLAVRSDPRDGKALSGYVNLLNIDGATRSFAANAYLGPARQRPNLKVVTGVFVTNIVSERSGGKIAPTGVRWTKNGSTYEATAAREVVLAAGSIASPQLLEVSAIGDKRLLRGVRTNEDYVNATYFQEQLDLYIQNRTGRLPSAGASSTLPSLRHIVSTAAFEALYLGFSSDTTKLFSASAQGGCLSIIGVIEHPFFRGSVHSIVDPRYLSNPADVSLLKAIALHLQTVAPTKPLSDLLQGDGTVYQPGFHELTALNVEEWVRSSMQNEYHPCGTCAMMRRARG